MTSADEYLRIALAKAQGNKTLAKKALLDMAAKDAYLAQQLALPYLNSICTHAIDRFMRHGELGDFKLPEEAAHAAPPTPPKPAEKGVIPPTDASEDHKANVLRMVRAFQKKD